MKLCKKHKKFAQYIRFERAVDDCPECQKLQNTRIKQLEDAIGKAITDLSTANAIFNKPQMDNSHVRKSIEKARKVQKDLIIAQKALDGK